MVSDSRRRLRMHGRINKIISQRVKCKFFSANIETCQPKSLDLQRKEISTIPENFIDKLSLLHK